MLDMSHNHIMDAPAPLKAQGGCGPSNGACVLLQGNPVHDSMYPSDSAEVGMALYV